LEDRFAGLLPEVELGVDAVRFAQIAAAVFTPRPAPSVGLGHLHAPKVSVVEQARAVLAMLMARGKGGWASFAELTADCETTVQIVARFLALLELYREKVLEFDQPDPLGPLAVAWTGDDDNAGVRFTPTADDPTETTTGEDEQP
jgi:segregation and condensation protein A